MNTIHKSIVLGLACAVAVPMLLVVEPAAARATSCQVASAASLDSRLAAKADQGPASLRRYLTRTQTIYGLDWTTAVARAHRFHQARAACVASKAS